MPIRSNGRTDAPAAPKLFAEPRHARYATKEELLPPGGYESLPSSVLGHPDISPADKCVYAALLNHLRGAATWVYPGQERLATMTALTDRAVRDCLKRLEAADLIERRRVKGRVAVAFVPLESKDVEQDGLLIAQEAKKGPEESSGTTGKSFRSDRKNLPLLPEESSAEASHRIEAPSEAAGAGSRRSEVVPSSHPSPSSQDCLIEVADAGGIWGPAADIALGWEDAMRLDERRIPLSQEEDERTALAKAAKKLLEGSLGQLEAAKGILATVAHQIGHREPPASKPVGMFLAEVSKLEKVQLIRQSRGWVGAGPLRVGNGNFKKGMRQR